MVGEPPKGPLAVRWHTSTVQEARAGAPLSAWLRIENAGSATWVSEGEKGIQLAYHWLDELGNPIVWDGIRTPLPRPVAPGETIELEPRLRAPMPPGPYRLAFDLVHEHRYWFAELGNTPLELELPVRPRIERALAVRGADPGALDRQEEPVVPESEAAAIATLAPGCVPAPDWSRRILDAHQEGYVAVGGAIEPAGGLVERRRAAKALAQWAPGTGRNPSFSGSLLCPSLLAGFEGSWSEVEGLPALEPPDGEPWLYDGRIRVTARPRSGRRRA